MKWVYVRDIRHYKKTCKTTESIKIFLCHGDKILKEVSDINVASCFEKENKVENSINEYLDYWNKRTETGEKEGMDFLTSAEFKKQYYWPENKQEKF